MQKITETLLFDKATLIKKVSGAVSEVLQMDTTPKTDDSEAKIKALTDKKQGLIELYLAKDITKLEFQELKEKYDANIATIKQSETIRAEKIALKENRQIILDDMQAFITSLVAGERWDDTFYRNLLDTITVAEDNTLTIKLNLLPYKWNAVLKSEQTNRHFDTSQPISVNSPFSSG